MCHQGFDIHLTHARKRRTISTFLQYPIKNSLTAIKGLIPASAAGKKNEEALKLYLEEEDSLVHQIGSIISESMQGFPEEDDIDDAVKYAAEIVRAVTTDTTRGGHLR
jgi:hypothetical protein